MKENIEIKTRQLLLEAIKILQEKVKSSKNKNFKLK